MAREYTIMLERFEMFWLTRHLQLQLKGAENTVQTLRHMAEDQEAQKKIKMAQDTLDILTPLLRWCEAEWNKGENERLKRLDRLEELQDAFTLLDDEEAKHTCSEEEWRLRDSAPYKYPVKVDRTIIKFILKLLEVDLEFIRVKIINEKKKDPSEYTDPIFKQSYYVNKMERDKRVLETLTDELKRFL